MSAAPIGDQVKSKSLAYNGPAQQVNRDVGEACGTALLEPGKVYSLPEQLAERLLASSPHWSEPTKASSAKAKEVADVPR